jgi:hypothetical protein
LYLYQTHLSLESKKKGDNAFVATRKQLLGRVSVANIIGL